MQAADVHILHRRHQCEEIYFRQTWEDLFHMYMGIFEFSLLWNVGGWVCVLELYQWVTFLVHSDAPDGLV